MSGIEYFVAANPILTYALIFFAMFIEGEGVILLASLFAWRGQLDWIVLALTIISGTIIADLVWYAGGRFLRDTRIGNWIERRFEHTMGRIDDIIRTHYEQFSIVSRFMYGTTHITLFLVGWNKYPFKRFLWITCYSATAWALTLLGAGYFLGATVELIGYKKVLHRIELFTIVLFALVYGFGYLLKKVLSRKLEENDPAPPAN